MKKKVAKKYYYFWTEGDEGFGEKLYLGKDPKHFIDFLKNNDPVKCGCDLMTVKQFNKLPEAL